MSIDMNTVVMQRQDMDVTDIDGEKAMMDMKKGRYYMLNEVGSRIWDIISNKCIVKNIVSILMNEYEIDQVTCEQSTIEFLERLNDDELIYIV